MGKKYVYMFSEGNASMRNLLGGKGANLAEMTVMGLPIPQGFTVTTEACTEYNEGGKVLSDEVVAQIEEALKKLEAIAGKTLGDNENPLLVSVRSGARASDAIRAAARRLRSSSRRATRKTPPGLREAHARGRSPHGAYTRAASSRSRGPSLRTAERARRCGAFPPLRRAEFPLCDRAPLRSTPRARGG